MQQGQNGVSYAIPHKYPKVLIIISSSPRNGIDIFCFFSCTAWLMGSLFPDQGLNPRPSTVQGRVLTIGPPGNSRNLKPVNLKWPDQHCQAICLIYHCNPLKKSDFTITNPLFCLVQFPYSCSPLATKIFHFIALP